ncbi:MAG: hypothetical protein J0L75_20400 [Spirochaetes bacterium]|nr:hypothetical protein [Spirochaetota bacterium]
MVLALLILSILNLAGLVLGAVLLDRRLRRQEHHLKLLRKAVQRKDENGPAGMLSTLMAGRSAAITGIKERYAQHPFVKDFISQKEGQILDPAAIDEFLGDDRAGDPYGSRPDFNPRDALLNLFEVAIQRGLLKSDDQFYRELLGQE